MVFILGTRAHDNVGNKDLSLASFTWTVDTVPPITSIVSTSDGNRSASRMVVTRLLALQYLDFQP